MINIIGRNIKNIVITNWYPAASLIMMIIWSDLCLHFSALCARLYCSLYSHHDTRCLCHEDRFASIATRFWSKQWFFGRVGRVLRGGLDDLQHHRCASCWQMGDGIVIVILIAIINLMFLQGILVLKVIDHLTMAFFTAGWWDGSEE